MAMPSICDVELVDPQHGQERVAAGAVSMFPLQ